MKQIFILLLIFIFQACSSIESKNFYITSLGSGTVGALLGSTFSPNEESKNLNALSFGIIGAGLGALSYLSFLKKIENNPAKTLQERELFLPERKEFVLPPTEKKLPNFVKERLTPIIIEEYIERDSVREDGSLSEPHRVWRIKRPPELIPKPLE